MAPPTGRSGQLVALVTGSYDGGGDRGDRADATHVEITFAEAGEASTRIEIVHSGWERLGADATAWRDANQAGWDGLLPHFVAACGPIDQRSPTNKELVP